MMDIPSLLLDAPGRSSLEERLRKAPLVDVMLALTLPNVLGEDVLGVGPVHSMSAQDWKLIRTVVTEKRSKALRYINNVYGALADHLNSVEDGVDRVEENSRPVQTEWEKIRFLLQKAYLSADFIAQQWPGEEHAALRHAITLIQNDADPAPAQSLRDYLRHKEVELHAHVYRDISQPELLSAFYFPLRTPCGGQSRYKRSIAGKCARNLAEQRLLHGGEIPEEALPHAWIAARPHDLGGVTIYYGGDGNDKRPVEVGFSHSQEFFERHGATITGKVDGYDSADRISRIRGTIDPTQSLAERAGVALADACSIELCVVNFAKGVEHEIGFGVNRRMYDERKLREFRHPSGEWMKFSAQDIAHNLYFTHQFSVSADRR